MPNRLLQILIVEDDVATNTALRRVLSSRGHQVTTVATGEAAVTTIRAQRFHLLISDIGLPDTDGWTLLQQLRAHQPGLNAIAITGFGYENDIKRSNEAGFNIHITKPVSIEQVEEAIKQLCKDATSL